MSDMMRTAVLTHVAGTPDTGGQLSATGIDTDLAMMATSIFKQAERVNHMPVEKIAEILAFVPNMVTENFRITATINNGGMDTEVTEGDIDMNVACVYIAHNVGIEAARLALLGINPFKVPLNVLYPNRPSNTRK